MPVFERIAADLPVTLKTASYTLLEADTGTEIQFQSTSAIAANLPAVVEVPNGYNAIVRNVGSGLLTIEPSASETVDGSTSLSLVAGEYRWIRSDGTAWKSISGSAATVVTGKWNDFTLVLINNSGTLQHRIDNEPGGGTAFYASAVNGASSTDQNTPTGTDSSTAFVTGVKISSVTTSNIVLDTKDFVLATDKPSGVGTLRFNSTGMNLLARISLVSRNVNGVTRTRLEIRFSDISGNDFALNTTNIASGKSLQVVVTGYFGDYV